MPALLTEMLAQVKAIWARLDAGQRLTIGAVLLATLVGLGSIVWFAGRPDWQAVFSSTNQRDLMQAAQALDRGGITYKIEGNSLLIEQTRIEPARRALTAAGVSVAAQATNPLTSAISDRETRLLALARMVEQDAETKLARIQGVLHAQVSHSKPKRSPYAMLDRETQPRANVGLRLAPGASFLGVARVAVDEASAALGIPPEYVTVTNLGTTQTFALDTEGGGKMDASEFLAQQNRRSQELTEQAQSLLDRLYPDKAVARVTVVLDPEWRVVRERGAPDKPAVKRSINTKDDVADTRPASGDPSAVGTGVRGSGGLKKESKETEYATDGFKETSTGKLAPDVRQLSVALVIDADAAKDQNLDELKSLIKNAIGWPEGQDDKAFSIVKTKMPDLPEPAGWSPNGALDLVERFGPTVGQVVAVLLVLLFLKRLLRQQTGRATSGKAAAATAATTPASQTPATAEDQMRRMRREIERAIGEDPATVSRLLESWLTEHKA